MWSHEKLSAWVTELGDNANYQNNRDYRKISACIILYFFQPWVVMLKFSYVISPQDGNGKKQNNIQAEPRIVIINS